MHTMRKAKIPTPSMLKLKSTSIPIPLILNQAYGLKIKFKVIKLVPDLKQLVIQKHIKKNSHNSLLKRKKEKETYPNS